MPAAATLLLALNLLALRPAAPAKELPRQVVDILQHAKRVELFSIFWQPFEDKELPPDVRGRQRFGAYPILGRVDVTRHKEEILAAIRRGVAESDTLPTTDHAAPLLDRLLRQAHIKAYEP